MKKGRRQIVEKNVFQNQENQQSTQVQTIQGYQPASATVKNTAKLQSQIETTKYQAINSKTTQQTYASSNSLPNSTNIPKTKSNPVNLVDEQSSISPYSVVKKKETTPIENKKQKQVVEQPNSSDKNANDQKKSRIEMLKQKYMKKGPEPKASEFTDVVVQHSKVYPQKNEKQSETIINTKEISNPKKDDKKEIVSYSKSQKQQPIAVVYNDQPEQKIELPQTKKNRIQPNRIPPVIKNELVTNKIQHQQHLRRQQNVPILNGNSHENYQKKQLKNQEKKQYKVPPPPPPKNKIRSNYTIDPPPIQTQQLTPSITSVIMPSEDTVQTTNYQLNTQSQHYQTTGFGLPNNVQPHKIKPNHIKQVKSKVPPPPPSSKKNTEKPNAVQQILQKKLRKQVKNEREDMFPQVKDQQVQQQFLFKNPINAPQFKQSVETKKIVKVSEVLDEEYIETIPVPSQHKPESKVSHNQFNFQQCIKLWCNGSEKLFPQLFESSNRICSIINKRTSSQIVLHSNNPEFKLLMNRIVVQLVLKNRSDLSDDQKNLVHQIGLQYFFSKNNLLSTQFLLFLVKLGNNYLFKYKQFFKFSIQQYCLDLLQYRTYLNELQIANFVDFLLDHWTPKEQHYYLLIILSPTQKLLTNLYNNQIQDKKAIIFALAAAQHVFKTNKSILGLYIRLISTVCDLIQQNFILQAILKYVNQIEPHQKYYQAQKQIKLKLIGLISTGQSNTVQRKSERVEPREQKQQKKDDKRQVSGGGFMGIWSKAVDKIKIATSQLTEKQKQKPEEPSDEIKYDPVTKRYMVNGKFLQDQDNKQPQSPTKAPPPPLPKANKPVAPPPPGNKKPRTVTAVNRYA